MIFNGDFERAAGLTAVDAPASQDRAISDRHEIAVGQHPDDLLVTKTTAELAGAAGVDGEAEAFDDEGEAGF